MERGKEAGDRRMNSVGESTAGNTCRNLGTVPQEIT